jgi:paromamine 6'-oxidase/6'''-hydroxyneomycin C oxidase/2'-deamino-2'-hydroxyparomamine 6'-oxidase
VILDYRPDPRDLARLDYMVARASHLLRASGCQQLHVEPSHFELGSAHLHGTCRFAEDPRQGVTDREGRLHCVENVYVADGSFMPYPGGVNPTLTIQANALRVASGLGSAFA